MSSCLNLQINRKFWWKWQDPIYLPSWRPWIAWRPKRGKIFVPHPNKSSKNWSKRDRNISQKNSQFSTTSLSPSQSQRNLLVIHGALRKVFNLHQWERSFLNQRSSLLRCPQECISFRCLFYSYQFVLSLGSFCSWQHSCPLFRAGTPRMLSKGKRDHVATVSFLS
mgnify:CR=1 FL=1